ncbi:hypothetical protein SAMN04487906_2382 [Zhouia amylolytica]|uniref:Uncharacterized protein n=1 Tax=Zhouia amylolytica TaxID=376730 RepID=A0A1I6U5A6_9FLAO|nr:hypothetical protein [Zhouia amylolytica]SFS96592.1 hypothetical protein SAMN04487906_2382 [Zhouia amylolytica]
MTSEAIHTEIIDRKTVDDIEIIQENPDNYPKGKSNIYAKNSEGKIVWYAELPLTGDIYPNPIQWNKSLNAKAKNWDEFYVDNQDTFTVSSWHSYTVSISYETGKIIQSEFTK